MANTHTPALIRIALESAEIALQEAAKHSRDGASGFVQYAAQQVRLALSLSEPQQ
jgi:hypothetical protein